MLVLDQLQFRRIDPDWDADVALANHTAACVATYGSRASVDSNQYLAWLRRRIEEFPDGHVLVSQGSECVGQLEMEAPYGLPTGYIDLYVVRQPFRNHGVGHRMHAYVERYFRSWEVSRIELHVAQTNEIAQRFYRSLGYWRVRREGEMFRMALDLG